MEVVAGKALIVAETAIVATGEPGSLFSALSRHFAEAETYVALTPPLGADVRRTAGTRDAIVEDRSQPPHRLCWTADDRILWSGADQPRVDDRKRKAVLVQRTGQLMYELSLALPAISARHPSTAGTHPGAARTTSCRSSAPIATTRIICLRWASGRTSPRRFSPAASWCARSRAPARNPTTTSASDAWPPDADRAAASRGRSTILNRRSAYTNRARGRRRRGSSHRARGSARPTKPLASAVHLNRLRCASTRRVRRIGSPRRSYIMFRQLLSAVLLVLAVGIAPAIAQSQAANGSIEGTIVDDSGAVLPGRHRYRAQSRDRRRNASS